MRPWMIVLSSTVGAVVVSAALAVLSILDASPSEIGPNLLVRLPALAVAALAAYGLCALLLTTAALLASTLGVRRDLARTPADRSGGWWVTTFAANGLRPLALRLAALGAGGSAALQTPGAPDRMSGEIARLYYISLARSHFSHGSDHARRNNYAWLGARPWIAPPLLAAIPTTSAILVTLGLLLLAVLARIAIAVTAEPLLEAVALLPGEGAEVGLLRRAVELLEILCRSPSAADPAPLPPARLPEGLVTVIEQGQHALMDAVSRLSADTQSTGVAMRAAVDALETALRTNTAPPPSMGSQTVADIGAFAELQAAVEELTALLQRLSAAPEHAEETGFLADPVLLPRRTPISGLARELRRLLHEIDAGR